MKNVAQQVPGKTDRPRRSGTKPAERPAWSIQALGSSSMRAQPAGSNHGDLRRDTTVIQPKLTIGSPSDKYEREADQVARAVVSGSNHIGLKLIGGTDDRPVVHRLSAVPTATAPPSNEAVPASVGKVLTSGRGRPLDSSTREFMESRFGSHDFGSVRVHTNTKAAHSARAIGAEAYTVGRDIVFGQGCYAPHTNQGKQLLAHELTHALQQQGDQSSHKPSVQLKETGKKPRKFLRNILVARERADLVSDPVIMETEEFISYMDSRNIWQWKDKVTKAEALLACRLILADLNAGIRVNWPLKARSYIDLARSQLSSANPQPVEAIAPEDTDKTKREDVREAQEEISRPTENACGPFEEGSLVFKIHGKIPESAKLLGQEWEFRMIQRGKCCRTYVLRAKITTTPSRNILKHFQIDGKIRGDVRRTDNLCTRKEPEYSGRISWEGKLRLLRSPEVERRLKDRKLPGGLDVVIKPQVAVNISRPRNKQNLMRLTGRLLVRLGAELSIGQGAFELRWHPFECNFASAEVGHRGINSWDIHTDECLDALLDWIVSIVTQKPEIKTPGIPIPWYQKSDDFGNIQF